MTDKPSSVHPLTQGFLGKEMYVIITKPIRTPEIEKHMPEHLAYQIDLEKRGITFGAGPLFERGSDKPDTGMVIIRAKSFEEAEAIANADPFHKAGLRTYTLQRWRLNEGRITIAVDFSDQSMKID